MIAPFQFGPLLKDGEIEFRLWAPSLPSLGVDIGGMGVIQLAKADDGWWFTHAPCGAGTQYRFVLPDGTRVPDPASRAQPNGVHGPSVVVDASQYRWNCVAWKGRPWHETVLYEVHPGIMGGYRGIAAALPRIAALGVTAIELMPIAEVSGTRNWGYDGVLPFAPTVSCGTPDDLRDMIDRAHELGLMVFLDVVYNHFGPDGNFLPAIAPEFFRDELKTPWGAAIDFRRPQVRRFFIENALYWLGDYRFDGLRLDAVHAISEADWLDEAAAAVRASFPDRHVHLVLENEHNAAAPLRGQIDAQWNDDFHNVMHVLLTGETTSYYADFADKPAGRLARALAEGFIYQGEPSSHQNGKRRGSPSGDLPPTAFVDFLQNHDQVGNRALGERLVHLADPRALKAATALLLLSPHIPLLFMGEEFGAREPFLFFTDFHDDLADAVREGRRREFASQPAFSDPKARAGIPDPNALTTFAASRFTDTAPDAADWHALYTSLIAIRLREIMPALPGTISAGARAIGEKAVAAAWRLEDGRHLTIAANFAGTLVPFEPPATPLIWGDETGSDLPAYTTRVWLG